MKRIKKLIICAAAVAILGTGYCAKITNYRHMGDAARIIDEIVVHQKDYEGMLLEELGYTGNEKTANGMIELGSLARKRINIWKKPAEDFAQNPYDLVIAVEHTPEGEKAYLIDLKAEQKLPVYRDNQVGDVGYRVSGMYEGAKRELKDGLGKLKTKAVQTIDGIMDKLEGKDE